MLGAFKKMNRLVFLIVVVVIGLALFAFYEIQSSHKILEEALSLKGVSVAEAVARGGENALRAQLEIEQLVAKRLLNNARLIRDFEPKEGFTNATLIRLGHLNDLFRINVFDPQGRRIASNVGQVEGYKHRGQNATDHIDDILLGQKEEKIIGLKQARFEKGNRFAVVVARKWGGAIVVNVDAAKMLGFYQSVGIERVLVEMGGNPGILYARLEYLDGRVIQSREVDEMVAWADDPFLQEVSIDAQTKYRELRLGNMHTFEIVMPFDVAGEILGVLRIGLFADILQNQRVRIRWRLALLSLLMVLLTSMGWYLYKTLIARAALEKELKRTDRLAAMGELASGVAHEVRNPLNSIGMSVQLLSRTYRPEKDVEGFQTLVSRIYGEVKRVNGIVQQFLIFAKPPPLKLKPVHLSAFLRDAAAVMQTQIEANGLVFGVDCEDEGMVMIDRDQMTQVLVNLLKNAVAATDKGQIGLACGCDGSWAWFSVLDTGHGILPEKMERIFDLYYTEKDDGLGLGLSLVHRIVAEHGGRLEVESDVGKGSCFRVVIPRGI